MKEDIYQIDSFGYPYGYIELYHRDKTTNTARLATRRFFKKPNMDIGYCEAHFDYPYMNQYGIAYYYIK